MFPPQEEGNARKEAASYEAEETISKPQPPSILWLNLIFQLPALHSPLAAYYALPDKMKDKLGPTFRQGVPGLEEFSCCSSGRMGWGVPS